MASETSADLDQLLTLPEPANAIIERAISNVRRKLVGGYRNKNNSRPNAKTADAGVVATDTLNAASAASVLQVGQRGAAWKEMIQKSLSQGISSIKTMNFDGEFTIKNGKAEGLKEVPNEPGVYIVFNLNGKPIYVGDSTKMQKRWHAGHLNEHRQGQRTGKPYKLGDHLEEGCTVRYIVMESEVTAAALEAHLIKTEMPELNAREELKTEQGKRSNIEAKKIKEASGETITLVKGAAIEAGVNMGVALLEQLADVVCLALKDELVDIFKGSKTSLNARIKRFFLKLFEKIKSFFREPLKIISGLVEFIVNALSKAISEIYALARNLCDLAQSAWNLYRGAETMSKEELINKISETILISGVLVFWDAIDPVLELQLSALLGPAGPMLAPLLAASITAIGFGISSYYLRKIIPVVVAYLINFRLSFKEGLDAQRATCDQLLLVFEQEVRLIGITTEYIDTSNDFIFNTQKHTRTLLNHKPIERLNFEAVRRALPSNAREKNNDVS